MLLFSVFYRKWQRRKRPEILQILTGISVFLTLSSFFPCSGTLEGAELIYAFRSYDSLRPEKMLLVGEIRTKTKAPEPYKTDTPFLNYDNRLDYVTIKVLDRQGIKVGQKLYVIDKKPFHKQHRNGLIMGEVIVRSIIYNQFYGWVITAAGNLLRVREGHFVARTLDSENLERAFVTKKKGDHYYNRNEYPEAIAAYEEALEQDNNLPEAHAALGKIYLQEARESGREEPVRAISQFEAAWATRQNFRYEYDAYQFYLDYMDALILRFEDDRSVSMARDRDRLLRYLERAHEAGREAIKMKRNFPGEVENRLFLVNFRMAQAFRTPSTGEERTRYDRAMGEIQELLKTLLSDVSSDPILHRTAILFYGMLYEKSRGVARIEQEKLVEGLYQSPVYRLYRSTRSGPVLSDTVDRIRSLLSYHREMYYRTLEKGRGVDPEVEGILKEIL